MSEENQSNTVWRGKGQIVYNFSIKIPERPYGAAIWHSNTLGDAWKYCLSVTGAGGQYENQVPEISFLAETKPGIVRDMAAYIDLGRSMRDRQFLNLPQISPDNVGIVDNTNGTFHGIDINAIFANAKLISDAQPPPGEPVYIVEITKNDKEPQDKQYNVNIIYANGFIDYTGLADSEPLLHEGIDKFSRISAMQIPAVIARYMITTAQRNDIRPNQTNIKIINFTDNPEFTMQQIFATIKAVIPPSPMQVQIPSVAMQGGAHLQSQVAQASPAIAPATTGDKQEKIDLGIAMQKHRMGLPLSDKEVNLIREDFGLKRRMEEKTEKMQEAPKVEQEKSTTIIKPQNKAKRTTPKKNNRWHFYKPKYGFDSVIGMNYAKKFFHDNIILGLKRPDLFAKYKKNIHDGFLLYGPPGIGKTYLVGALAKEAKMKLLVVSIHQLLNMYLGNTEKNIHAIFEQARKNAPCIILFDEIDGLGMSRNISRESGTTSSALALQQLLMEMDSLENENKDVIVIGTTNAPQDIDTALLRSGRFTNMLYMRPPDKEDRTKLFEFYADDIPKEQLDYEKLGGESNNLSPADIKAVVKGAVTPLIAEAAEGGKAKELTTDDLLHAIHSRRASGSTMIKWYEDMDRVLHKGGFSEEEKLLYGDMLKDIKKRTKIAPRISKRNTKEGTKHGIRAQPIKVRQRA